MINVKNPKPNPSFSLKDIVGSHGWRKKWWRHAQIAPFIRSENNESEANAVDPNYWLTQSGKNYQYANRNISRYSNPRLWRVQHSILGMNLRQNPINPMEEVYQNFRSDQWHRAAQFAYLFYKIPGVKKVYVLGSVPLDISTEKSDIDFAIQTAFFMPLVSRFWIKIVLKILRVDVHPLWLSFSRKNSKQKLSEISKHKQKMPGIDVGLIYHSEVTIEHFYGNHVRHMWLHIRTLIARQPEDVHNSETATYLWKPQHKIVDLACQAFLLLISIPLLPLILCQLLLQHNDPANNVITPSFINYYPLSGHANTDLITEYTN